MQPGLSLHSLPDAGFAVAVLAVIVAGFLRGFIGFGAALISVPILSVIYGPLAAVPISNLLGLPAVVVLLPDAIRFSERRIVVPVSAAIFVASPLGAWLLVGANQAVMKIVICSLVIVMVAMLVRGWRLRSHVTASVLIGAGAAGGLVQGAAGIGGPPVVAVALSRPGEVRQQRGNVLAFMAAISLSSILPFAFFGLFTPSVIAVAVLLLPAYLLSIWLGTRYFAMRGQRHFRAAALWLLMAIAVTTLLVSVRGYLQQSPIG